MNAIFRRRLLASSLLISVVTFASPAVAQDAAQDAPAPADEVVVTGSRIARPNLEQSNPVSVISADEIAFQQPVSAEEFLRELPGAVANIGPGVNNGTNGSAQLDLRGLGANRNLILIDGQRVVPASLASVTDLNLVPVALIERVDILTGGASSAYGADAVAGVVNFITRSDFAGVDISGNIGITERGDGAQYRTDVTIGANFDDGRGNAVFSVGYAKTNPIEQGSRDSGRVSLSSTTGLPQGSATATPASILSPFFGRVNATGTGFDVGPLSDYNFNPLNVYQTPFERYSLFAKANYEISDAVEIYTQGFYTKTIVDQIIAPSGTFFTNLELPLNNPFLTAAQRNTLCANFDTNTAVMGIQPIDQAACNAAGAATSPTSPGYREITTQIGRRFTEAGPRLTNFTTNTFQISGGLRGPLTDNLDWNISGLYGESERTNTSQGQGTRTRLQQALRASSTTACTVATGGCVPINLFGVEGTITPAAFNFLNVQTFNFIQTSLTQAQANISGDLGFASPFATENVGIALGVEYRKYVGSSGGDGISSIPGEVLGAGAPALPIRGEYDTREVFGEIIIPLVEDRPFFQNLTIQGGFRYSDYSTSGGNWAYNAGASWTPIDAIKFRGSYARAVRAPNLGELFQPQITGLTNRAIDPCQLALPNANATVRALCVAQLAAVGAPAGVIGSIPAPIAGQINFTSGGNQNLTPETADTYTVGVVLQPTSLITGFAVTFDYYNITVKDAISSPSQADVIDACFAQSSTTFDACQSIRRNPLTGGLSGPNDTTFGPFLGLSNLGTIKTSGFDLGVSFRKDLGFAALNMNFQGNYTLDSLFQSTPTSLNRECTSYYSVSCASIQPEYTWNLRTTLSFGGSDVSLLWRHISANEVEPLAPAPQRPVGTPTTGGPVGILPAYQRIPAYNYFDFSFQQRVTDVMRFTFTVANLFDKDPPIVGNTIGSTAYNSGNTYPSTYDAIGRRFLIGANLRF